MSVLIKSAHEIEGMRESNRRLAHVHEALGEIIRPGISTYEINAEGERLIREMGGTPNFLNYEGYPASVCVSVNDEVVHGIPKKERILKEGDIVSLDTGMVYKGFHSDAARTYGVGNISMEAQFLIDSTRESFFAGIKKAVAGNYLYDISAEIDAYASARHLGIVRDLTGHGIGRKMHEDPFIPNFRMKGRGILLVAGMTLAVEPMLTLGTWKVRFLADGWTVQTADHSLAAHYENTILITDGEPEILSLLPERK